jgi:hypothetical protein
MPLSTFLTFLAFLTRKLRRLAVEQTRSLLDGLVRARLIEAGDEQDRQPRYPSVAGQPATFFRGANARKARKVRKGGSLKTLYTFPTFLTQTFPGLAGALWQGSEFPPCSGRQRFAPSTLGPAGRPESVSDTQCCPVGAPRIGAAMPYGI